MGNLMDCAKNELKLCEEKGFNSPDCRKGMFKLYDLLIKFCWEAKASCGQQGINS